VINNTFSLIVDGDDTDAIEQKIGLNQLHHLGLAGTWSGDGHLRGIDQVQVADQVLAGKLFVSIQDRADGCVLKTKTVVCRSRSGRSILRGEMKNSAYMEKNRKAKRKIPFRVKKNKPMVVGGVGDDDIFLQITRLA